MCRSMVDIQSATAEITRGIKKDRKIETTGQNIMPASATQGCHKQFNHKHFQLCLDTYDNHLHKMYNKSETPASSVESKSFCEIH